MSICVRPPMASLSLLATLSMFFIPPLYVGLIQFFSGLSVAKGLLTSLKNG
jgi:putative effector of murein hydrolase LrgA (UPF0299 family)